MNIPEVTVVGTLKDRYGDPQPFTTVNFQHQLPCPVPIVEVNGVYVALPNLYRTMTDENGHFEIKLLPTNGYYGHVTENWNYLMYGAGQAWRFTAPLLKGRKVIDLDALLQGA